MKNRRPNRRADVTPSVRHRTKGTDLAAVVRAVQDATTDHNSWRAALDAVATVCGGHAPVLFTHDSQRRQGRVLIGPHLDESVGRRYATYYAERNVLMNNGSHLLEPGLVRTSQMMCDEGLYLKSEYYNDFVKPMGLEQALGTTLHKEGSRTYNFAVYRTYRRPAFDRHELRLLAAITPHLTRAVTLFEQFATIRQRADTFREVLHQLTDGVLVVDRHGRIVEANRTAEALLRAGDGLRSTPLGIAAVLPDESRALRAAVATATRVGGTFADESGDSMAISRANGLPPLSVVVTSIRRNTGFDDDQLACLFVRDTARAGLRTAWLNAAFRLTAAESRVVALLVLGLSTAQLAASTKVSKETIRTHIKRILAKTGARHRSQLVSMVLAGAVPVTSR